MILLAFLVLEIWCTSQSY